MSLVNTYFDQFQRRKSAGVVQNGVLLLFICAMPAGRPATRPALPQPRWQLQAGEPPTHAAARHWAGPA